MLLSELAARTGATLDGDGAVDIVRMATLEDAGPGDISFLSNPKYHSQLARTRAGAVIVATDIARETALPKLVGGNPYAIYARVATLLYPRAAGIPGVHRTAIVGEGARIAASAAVGPFAVVGAGTVIGERAEVGTACAIGANVVIADDVRLFPRVTIYDGCQIGARTTIHSGAVIGADGFGNAEEAGRWIKIPQIGRVLIGADVEIGANTTIDRGALGDTIIEDDVKLDNQIQIGHNCRIGTHTAIAGCTGIAGSVRIGRNCKVGGAAMIAGHLSIADGVNIAAGTGIMGSIDTPGTYTGIFPMMPHGEWKRVAVAMRHLVSLSGRVKALERAAGGNKKSEEGT
jgi:UDP-3-O-[3-hydroxymyristoyl] glucosamine N-acyltransferase